MVRVSMYNMYMYVISVNVLYVIRHNHCHSCQPSRNSRDSPGFGCSVLDPEIYLDCPGFSFALSAIIVYGNVAYPCEVYAKSTD